jgi:hypothetical protein
MRKKRIKLSYGDYCNLLRDCWWKCLSAGLVDGCVLCGGVPEISVQSREKIYVGLQCATCGNVHSWLMMSSIEDESVYRTCERLNKRWVIANSKAEK